MSIWFLSISSSIPSPPAAPPALMASVPGAATAPAFALAIAVRDDGRSHRAVQWAAAHLVPLASRVVLVHVIPAVSSIPSPSGQIIPIGQIEREVVKLYVEDLKSKAQQVFPPFRKMCGRRNIETVVLEGDSLATMLLGYVSESGINNLVMGGTSMSWIRRLIKFPDAVTTVLQATPSSCNIYVVSRRKITMRLANWPIVSGSSGNTPIRSISHKTFAQSRRYCILDEQDLCRFSERETPKTPAVVNVGSGSQAIVGSASMASGRSSESSSTTSRRIPFFHFSSIKESDAPDIVKLRMELQNAHAMYERACEDLVQAKKKIQLLSVECSEEAKKVKEVLEREEMLKKIVAEEKAKHLEAMKEAEEARQSLARVVLERHKAEVVADTVSLEKSKVVDAILLSEKRCRRYSMDEIEAATAGFSEAKKIGEGSYGNVYKCNLDHTEVAVKVLRHDSKDGKDEFLKEVEILSQLHHPHLVLLLGFCPENGCLVYEYMENRSLEDQLFHRKDTPPLPWFIRFRVVYQVACGLAFLHGTKPEPVVHRDLKPGNILLDRNYVSKIGDVGLAKLISDVVPDGFTEYKETVLAGTLYYMDPEYQRTGTLRPKSDLYALGIVCLQLLTGQHPNGLVINIENAIKNGSFKDVLDKSISDWPVAEAEKLAKLALRCSTLRCRDRPDLESEVLPQLKELLDISNAYCKLRRSNVNAPSHFLCPILKEIMEDPCVAADGHTYEHRAIKAWLEKHKISPVTELKLRHTSTIPNYSLHSAIKEWKSHLAFLRC